MSIFEWPFYTGFTVEAIRRHLLYLGKLAIIKAIDFETQGGGAAWLGGHKTRQYLF